MNKRNIKPKNAMQTIKRLLGYITGTHRMRFLAVCVAIIVSAAAGVRGSMFLKRLIDDLIAPLMDQANPDFTPLFRAVILMACIYYVGVLCTYFYNFLMAIVSQGVLKQIRDGMFAHMQTLPIPYFDTHAHGEIMSRYTNDTDALEQMLSCGLPQVFSACVTIVSVIFSMLYISPYLTGFVFLFAWFMLWVTGKIAGKSSTYFVQRQQDIARVNGFVEEMMTGQKVIKVFCHEEEAKQDFDKLNEELCHSATQANKYANILMPVMGNLGTLQYVLLAAVGGGLAIGNIGGITLGSIAAFLLLSGSLTNPLSMIAQQLNFFVMAIAGAERIFELLDEEPEQDLGYVTLVNAKLEKGSLVETPERTGIWAWKHPHSDGRVTYTRVAGDVRFAGADFAYEEGNPVLHEITLFAEPGQKIAFVGSTGAGKTTITNLINRFYEIQDGKIGYDGIDINKIQKSALRRSLGMVLQDTHLFTGTILDNIRYGNLDATDEEVYVAARLANADGFISRMPQGYHTVLTGDGAELSQGQRQLLSIARAAVANPPVLILDEATSSIDTRTEAIVQNGMDALMQGRTVFVIAHRLSTVRDAEVIMVMEHGRIIERGNHEKLLAEKGRYYQLYTGAFELE